MSDEQDLTYQGQPVDLTKTWISHTGYVLADEGGNVYDAALNRIRHLFTLSPNYVVSFSGGKDSTTALMLSLQVARELGRLPLRVAFLDEEVIDPDTIAYAREIMDWDEIQFDWFCVRIRHTLRAKGRNSWHTWNDAERDVWVREMPEWAIHEVPGLTDGSSYTDVIEAYYGKVLGWENYVDVTGVRAQESFNRRRAIIQGGDYIIRRGHGRIYAKPIYDWTVEDVWRAIVKFNWPHSAYYDKLWLAGKPLAQQRVAPWGNVAGSRDTPYYAEFYPEFWEKTLKRLPELSAQARYGNTALYRETMNKPDHMTWQEYVMHLISTLNDTDRAWALNTIAKQTGRWARHSTLPYPDEPVMIDGKPMPNSWQRIALIISKNDRIKGASRDNL